MTMVPALILAVAFSMTAPAPNPAAADAGPPPSAAAQEAPPAAHWLSRSIAAVDGVLVLFTGDRPVIIGRTVVDPAAGDVPLAPGAHGAAVRRLQDRLRDFEVYRGTTDGIYGRETAASVVAFHKLIGTKRTNRWTIDDWEVEPAIDNGAILARHPSQADRVEVDITRQLLFVIRDNDVAAIVPVSTGNGEIYWSQNSGNVRATTPRGNFRLFRHIPGWRVNYLGGLYKPWYFTPYYAIHGSRSVPAHPASHGCVRIPTWESNHLDEYLEIGMPVHIWDA
jgi:lipoprotein-anchoring transpeptidase ErfK/SrfK